jgi:hypothetical protein
MTEARQPKGIPVGGQFAPDAHAEPALSLAAPRSYDPEAVAKGILTDLRDLTLTWTQDLYGSTHLAARSGKASYTEFLDGLIARNRSGRCEKHEHDPDHSPERHCRDCLVAFMVEARTNPKPDPVPRGVIPVRPVNHPLDTEQINRTYDRVTKIGNTTIKVTGDEKFEAAVRRLFDAPEGTPVEVIQEDCDYGTDWTRQSDSEITVKCGDRTAVYSYLGALMQDLDRKDRNPEAMALRFTQDPDAKRPLLQGTAAVYLYQGDDSDPAPVFGKIRDVFTDMSDPSMDFLHLDGRQEYLEFDMVVAVLTTDQTTESDEP